MENLELVKEMVGMYEDSKVIAEGILALGKRMAKNGFPADTLTDAMLSVCAVGFAFDATIDGALLRTANALRNREQAQVEAL